MRVEELRIGNYVIDNLEICQVIQIEANGNVMTTCKSRFPISNVEDLDPLKLTENVLLMCGFEKSTKYIFDHDSGVVFDAPNDWNNTSDYPIGIDCSKSVMGYNSEEIIIRCLTLHDLQNKFFAITGEDLKVDLQQTLLQETKTYNHGTNR